MNTLYFDCFSGISGDMSLAALVDLGADKQKIEDGLRKITSEKLEFGWKRVIKKGVSALHFELIPPYPQFKHFTFAKIQDLLQNCGLEESAVQNALVIFQIIAQAEAKIHAMPVEKVHFHEVGAIDSIIDILGVCLAVEDLKPKRILSSKIVLGGGSVDCMHGRFPVPAMATLEILKGIPVSGGKENFELTTPTGAGIIKHFAKDFLDRMPEMNVDKIGYGAGTRDLKEQPNVLRCIQGEVEG